MLIYAHFVTFLLILYIPVKKAQTLKPVLDTMFLLFPVISACKVKYNSADYPDYKAYP